MLWFAVAASGVGFAGYVYLFPYQQMQSKLGTRTAELSIERATVSDATAERDKLKASLAKFTDAEKDKASADEKRKAEVDALIAQLRPSLEPLGATVAVEEGTALVVSFPPTRSSTPTASTCPTAASRRSRCSRGR